MTTRTFSRWRMARRRIKGSATLSISIALWRRVFTPALSRAPCNARPLMTVASIPIWSACTRSMPWEAPLMPLKMFPPPITIPTWTPFSATALISSAYSAILFGSIPKSLSPINASPLNFSSTRLYFILHRFEHKYKSTRIHCLSRCGYFYTNSSQFTA